MATSRLTALRQAIVTQIEAQFVTDGVSKVTVTEYPPMGDYAREDRVWLSEIIGRQTPYTQGAAGFRQEWLEVELRVEAPTFGGTPDEFKAGEERAETIFASVENTLRGDITVSSTVYNIELETFSSSVTMGDIDGPFGYIEATLTAESHL